MFVRAVLILVVFFGAYEASTKTQTKLLKTYPSDSGYNPNQHEDKVVNAVIDELQLLRQQLETLPDEENTRSNKNLESFRGNASARLKQLNYIDEPFLDSLNYLIAKLEAKERLHRHHPGPEFSKKNLDPIDNTGFATFVKKNFDPIDRSGFGSFVKKNFDTIDRSGFNSFEKRNFDPIDNSGFNSFSKKNFDPIDLSSFNSLEKKNFDPIDRSGFNAFTKKNFDPIDRSGFASLNKKSYVKKMIDPIDRSGFNGFVKKNLDPLDRTGFDGFIRKRSIYSQEIPDDSK